MIVKKYIIDLDWIHTLNNDLIWDDDYSKLMYDVTIHDIIGIFMSNSVLAMNYDVEVQILTDLISYFNIEELTDEKIMILVTFISDLISRLSKMLYDDLYYQFKELYPRLEFIEWIDDVSLIVGIHDADYWR